MLRYLIRRILWAAVLFFVVTLVTYVIFFLVPNDLASKVAGQGSSQVAHIIPGLLRIGRHAQHSCHSSEEIFKLAARRDLSAGHARD